ncbi:MAG: hypothetical protein IPM29_26810 [Planctomycetes bacterium]|nr:hypothetical protein [Planctomycetota bacterium]
MKIHPRLLSDTARDELARVTRAAEPARNQLVLQLERARGKRSAVVVGSVLLAGLAAVVGFGMYRETSRLEFGEGPLLVMSGIGFLFAAMVVFNRQRLKLLRRSQLQPAVVISPLHVARTGLDHEPAQLGYLFELRDIGITHHHTNGAYTHTSFRLEFPGDTLRFDVRPRSRADACVAHLESCLGALRAGQDPRQLVDTGDWLATARQDDAGEPPPPGPGFAHRGLVKLAASVLLSALVVHAGWGVAMVQRERHDWDQACTRDGSSDYEDYLRSTRLGWHVAEAEVRFDDRLFGEAERAGNASALRDYLARLPAGRHAEQARGGVRVLYREAERAYLATAEQAEPQAAAGMKALLAHLAEIGSPQVGIVFLPDAGVDGDEFERSIRDSTGSSRVRSIAPSFTVDRNRQRHARIVAVMGASFRRVFAADLFALAETDADATGPRFVVRATVEPTDDYYTNSAESHLPIGEREIFPGFRIRFEFSLQVPDSEHPPAADPEQGYLVTTVAEPAPNITVSGDGEAAVYDRMVTTAFEQFEINLANAYGLELTMPADWGSLPGSRPTFPYGLPGLGDPSGLPGVPSVPTLPTLPGLPTSVQPAPKPRIDPSDLMKPRSR